MEITIPNKWQPRGYQMPLWRAFVSGRYTRFLEVAHRRWGKDSVLINGCAVKAVTEPGLYYYMAPTQKHGRKIIWDNIGRDGLRIVNQAFPEEIRKSTNDQEMRIVIESAGGKESIFQIVGSDNYDSIVGTNPKGLIFSEWALADKPEAWDYFRPILMENGGWAGFISTPRGLNHFYALYRMALKNPQWFCELQGADKSGALTPDQIQAERDAGMSEQSIRQEFYCEFMAPNEQQVFSGEVLLAASERKAPQQADLNAPLIVGCDIARFGADRTVIATRLGSDFRSIPPIIMEQSDLVQVARALEIHANKYKPDAICIDATGLGAGVVDMMRRDMRIPVTGIHFSEKARDREKYSNIRTEMYFNMQEWLEHPDSRLPDSQDLREELASIEFEYDNDGRFRLETKEKARKRVGHSPDLADAYALTFARKVPRKDAWMFRGAEHQNRQAVIGW